MEKKISHQLLMDYALNLLSQRKHSEFELKNKMLKKFNPEQELLQGVIDRLKDLKYLDDAEFAASWIRYRSQNAPRGRFLLARELKMKGIKSELIKEAFLQEEFDEEDLCYLAAEKKIRSLKPSLSPEKKLNKLQYFLSGRGFGISEILNTLQKYK